MAIMRRFRFSMATVMMLVVACGAASALSAKVHHLLKPKPFGGWAADVAMVLVLAIGLTALAFGAWRRHTTVQTLLQATLTCLMLLALFSLCESARAGNRWAIRGCLYWFQACFLLTVALPALAIRLGSPIDPDSPRSRWWRGTFEAVLASFANLCLVMVAAFLQLLGAELLPVLF